MFFQLIKSKSICLCVYVYTCGWIETKCVFPQSGFCVCPCNCKLKLLSRFLRLVTHVSENTCVYVSVCIQLYDHCVCVCTCVCACVCVCTRHPQSLITCVPAVCLRACGKFTFYSGMFWVLAGICWAINTALPACLYNAPLQQCTLAVCYSEGSFARPPIVCFMTELS